MMYDFLIISIAMLDANVKIPFFFSKSVVLRLKVIQCGVQSYSIIWFYQTSAAGSQVFLSKCFGMLFDCTWYPQSILSR
jgi:hypothetical protein